MLNSSPKTVLEHLDSISREICSAIDVAELCRNVHSEESYRRAADEAFTIVSGLIHKLNSDSTLYDSLTRAILNGQTQNSLTQEDLDFALDLKHEFESDGVHLSSIDKEKLVLLQVCGLEL